MRLFTLITALILPSLSLAADPGPDPEPPCRARIIEISHDCGGTAPETHSCVEVEYALDNKDAYYVCLVSEIAGNLGCLALAEYDFGEHRFRLGHLSDNEREGGFEAHCLRVDAAESID
jgi:hypothetical protein